MNYQAILIDSHVLLWGLKTPKKIGPVARRLLESTKQDVYISTASLWELGMKFKKGKLSYSPQQLIAGADELGFQFMAIEREHVVAVSSFLKVALKDPFDLMLVAQAHSEKFSLLTADNALLDLNLPFAVNARK